MSRNKNRRTAGASNAQVRIAYAQAPAQQNTDRASRAEAFSFGDPIEVLDRRELLDYVECMRMGKWFEPPMPLDGLARSFRAAAHHSSAIFVKRNILVSTFIPHKLLSRQAFERFVLDWQVFGNAYLESRISRASSSMGLQPALAKYMRRGLDLSTYYFVQSSPPARSFTCRSRTSTRRCTVCRNTSQRSMPRGSMSRPRCFAGATTRTDRTPASSCT